MQSFHKHYTRTQIENRARLGIRISSVTTRASDGAHHLARQTLTRSFLNCYGLPKRSLGRVYRCLQCFAHGRVDALWRLAWRSRLHSLAQSARCGVARMAGQRGGHR